MNGRDVRLNSNELNETVDAAIDLIVKDSDLGSPQHGGNGVPPWLVTWAA